LIQKFDSKTVKAESSGSWSGPGSWSGIAAILEFCFTFHLYLFSNFCLFCLRWVAKIFFLYI
jgi:hypothetical protein